MNDRLRVLHVVQGRGRRGAEVFAADLIDALSNADVDQLVALIEPGAPDGAVRFAVRVERLTGPMRSGPRGPLDVLAVRRLRHLVAAWRPDVVQSHGGDTTKYTMAAHPACPVVVRYIGMAPAWIRRGIRRASYAAAYRRADLVVPVAKALIPELVSLFRVPLDRVAHIPNGVASGRVLPSRGRGDARSRLGIAHDVPVSVSLGSLSWEKDPSLALRSVELARRRVPRLVHLFVGDGALASSVRSAAIGQGAQVRVLGSRDDVADVLAAADLLLFTSRPDGMEGMPAALIEAGLAGLAAVAADVAGVREVLDPGRTGLVVPHGDPARFADAVVALASSSITRERFGAAAFERCRERFTMRTVAPAYLSAYRSIVSAPGIDLRQRA